MNFTPEQLTKAKKANSAEELLTLAKENGMEMTDDEAKKYFADLHKEGELADDELENVSGGCGDPEPKYQVGTRVFLNGYYPYIITKILGYDSGWKEYFYELESPSGQYEGIQIRETLIDEMFIIM